MNKQHSFEYLLSSLYAWFYDRAPEKTNDLSVLKCLKLLFLVTAADIELNRRSGNNNQQDYLIYSTWNKFYALPLGHVESDIYGWINEKKGILNGFAINRNKLSLLPDTTLNTQNVDRDRIDNAIGFLKVVSPKDLILMEAFELVEITHKWNSWRFYFSGSGSTAIPQSVIVNEPKYFY